jgi:hypothetical protein
MAALADDKIGIVVDNLDPDLLECGTPIVEGAVQSDPLDRRRCEKASVRDADGTRFAPGGSHLPHAYLGFVS